MGCSEGATAVSALGGISFMGVVYTYAKNTGEVKCVKVDLQLAHVLNIYKL